MPRQNIFGVGVITGVTTHPGLKAAVGCHSWRGKQWKSGFDTGLPHLNNLYLIPKYLFLHTCPKHSLKQYWGKQTDLPRFCEFTLLYFTAFATCCDEREVSVKFYRSPLLYHMHGWFVSAHMPQTESDSEYFDRYRSWSGLPPENPLKTLKGGSQRPNFRPEWVLTPVTTPAPNICCLGWSIRTTTVLAINHGHGKLLS